MCSLLSLLLVSMYVFIERLMEEPALGLSLIKGRPLKYMTNARQKKKSDGAGLGP